MKEAPKQEGMDKKSKRQEDTEDEKGREYKRLTAAFAMTYNEATTPPTLAMMTNENGGRKVIG